MLQAPVNKRYQCKAVKSCYFKFRGRRFHFFLNALHIQYAHLTENEGVTSNLYIFVVFDTKQFRMMAAPIGGDFHVFKLVLKLI
jgi:hypothetical protein